MSSHREAPEISKDPVADNTDVYAFVSPDQPDTVTMIANFIPFQHPAGGPNFYEFGDDVLYQIHISNSGTAEPTSATSSASRPRSGTRRRSCTTPVRSPPSRPDLEPAAVLLGHPGRERPDARSSRTTSPARRSTSAAQYADYAKLAPQAVHTLGPPQGLRRSAGRRLLRRPRQHLRPRHAAAVPEAHLIPSADMGVNGLQGSNVHTIAIQVPITT